MAGPGPLASPDKVIGVVLLCALSLNAFYVAKWAFMCQLCGSKRVRLGPFWGCFGPFLLFSRAPSPHWRRSGLGVPGNAIQGRLLVLL